MNIHFEFHIHVHKDHPTQELVEPLCIMNQEQSFLEIATSAALKVQQANRINTYNNYMTAIRSFLKYLGHDIPVTDIHNHTIEGYERWLKDADISLNTISCYMRSLRSILNQSGIFETKDVHRLFKNVFTGTTKTEKRAISDDDIIRLMGVEVHRGSFEELTRDVFLFSFFAMGMPFVDVAFLRKEQIQNGKIYYHRHKTGQRICICLEPCMLEIIRKYQSKQSEYVFPIMEKTHQHQATNEYLYQLGKYNRTLKRLALRAGIQTNLTSYVVRHTWASLAYQSNVDLPVISKALGHTNTATTMVYIKEIDDQRLQNANRQLIQKTLNRK